MINDEKKDQSEEEKKKPAANKVYSAWLPNVSHDTIYRPFAATKKKK